MTTARAEAAFVEALALLSHQQKSIDLKRATELLERSARDGHAGAMERLALLRCRGLAGPPDWNGALDLLTAAAEAGSASAQRQLLVLADDRFDAAAPAETTDWSTLKSRIDLPRRLKTGPPRGTTRSSDPLVHAIPGFASQAECDWLIALASARLKQATVYGRPGGVDPGRTNRHAVLDLATADVVTETLRWRIADELGAPPPLLEIAQVLHYAVGQEFASHYDFLDPRVSAADIARQGQRAATFLIYLNEDYDGGETSFPKLGLAHRGRTGDALVFGNLDRSGQPDFRAEHAGTPPTRGEKWVLSQWVRDRPPSG